MSDWDDDSVPREPRKLWHDAMLLAAALIFLASVLLTETPLPPVNRPVVDDVAALPAKADRAPLADYIYSGTYYIPKLRRATIINIAKALARQPTPDVSGEVPIRLGYSVRELDFFGLPLFGYKDAGDVLYFDDWDSGNEHLLAAPLSAEGLAWVRKQAGSDIGSGWFFPFWKHMWGWIPLLLGAGWGWLQFRRVQRRRAQLGII